MDFSEYKTEIAYRSLGGADSHARIGAGIYFKHNRSIDYQDYRFECYAMVLVLKGRGTYVDRNGKRFELREGSVFQRFPEVLHSTYIDPESQWTEFFLDCGAKLYQALAEMRLIRHESAVMHIEPDDSLTERLIDFKDRLKICDEVELRSMVPELINYIDEITELSVESEESHAYSEMIEQACSYLGESFNNRFDLEGFCRKHGWGYESFRKVFKHEMGISPGKYRIRRRIDHACQLLSQNFSIAEVAEMLGYSTQHEFSFQFKKHTGIAPLYYRNRI